ncbi:UNVERIFIED_CONTAM: sec-independent protein translocase protein TatA [Brevibacillus sp. OAP136]
MHIPSLTGILFLLLVGVVLFGPSKLPQLGRAVGSTLKEFKLASQGLLSDDAPKAIAVEEKAPVKQSEQELRMQIEKEIRAQMEAESKAAAQPTKQV